MKVVHEMPTNKIEFIDEFLDKYDKKNDDMDIISYVYPNRSIDCSVC